MRRINPRPARSARPHPPVGSRTYAPQVLLGVALVVLVAAFFFGRATGLSAGNEALSEALVEAAKASETAGIAQDSATYWMRQASETSQTVRLLTRRLEEASATIETMSAHAVEASATIQELKLQRSSRSGATSSRTTATKATSLRSTSGVEQWRSLVSRYFGANADAALRVMAGESSGNPKATNGSCRGLFQIHSTAHASTIRAKASAWGMEPDLYDPAFNIRFAAYMSAGGSNFSAWTVQP